MLPYTCLQSKQLYELYQMFLLMGHLHYNVVGVPPDYSWVYVNTVLSKGTGVKDC